MYDSAIHYQRLRYREFTNSQMKKLDTKIYEIQESYQNEKIVAEKQRAENELARSNAEIIQMDYRSRMLLIFSLLILFILLILTIFFYKQRKSNKLLKDKNNEKDILLKEISHRVKNNMQMVSSLLDLQSVKVKDENSKQALKEAGERIKALAFAHQKLYLENDFKNINLKNYLKLIIDNLLLNSNCNLNLDFSNDYIMDIEKSQALGFIVNELITNSLKYAWPQGHTNKIISIKITNDGINRIFTYQDNGLGLPEDFTELKKKSLGFSLIDSFVKRQLNGTLEYINKEGCQITIIYDDNFIN
jgi:two-component sensor histidine kinase